MHQHENAVANPDEFGIVAMSTAANRGSSPFSLFPSGDSPLTYEGNNEMPRWFRLYDELLEDPKVQKLPADLFKAWINVLCLACKHDGKLPSMPDCAFALRLQENDAETVIERLVNAGLIDRSNGGPNGYHYAPHSWDKRQYKSDTSTERVKRFRNVSSGVAETAPDTESDTEQIQKEKKTRAVALSVSFESQLIESGVEPETIKAWKAVRFAKRAGPISEPVVKALKREASKAGLSLQQTITLCCERGWQGFQATWLTGTHASLKSQSYDKPRGIAGAAIEAMEHLNERPNNSGFGDYVERLPATAGNRPALADERLSNGFGRRP